MSYAARAKPFNANDSHRTNSKNIQRIRENIAQELRKAGIARLSLVTRHRSLLRTIRRIEESFTTEDMKITKKNESERWNALSLARWHGPGHRLGDTAIHLHRSSLVTPAGQSCD